MSNPEYPLSRIRWGCRRGMLELDRMLLPFFDTAYLTLSESEQRAFLNLLACEDTELYAWLFNEPAPPEHRGICEKIKAFHLQDHPPTFPIE